MKIPTLPLALLTAPITAAEVGLSHLDLIGDKLSLKTNHGRIALRYAMQHAMVIDIKQQDYGPQNISDFGLPGVIIRANDKMQRLKHLAGKQRRKPRNESIEDTLLDLSNYGIIGRMVIHEDWPLV